MNRDYTHQVEAGAQFLDERFPGWAQRIDLPLLDLSDCKQCVLGQMFGDFLRGAQIAWGGELVGLAGGRVVTVTEMPLVETDVWSPMYHVLGFDTPVIMEAKSEQEREEIAIPHYRRLTELWAREVERRQRSVQDLITPSIEV